MTINESLIATSASGRGKCRLDALVPWLKLAFGIALILIFIFGIGHLSTYIPGAKRMAEVINDNGLRPSAIFYTDFEASADGSEYIRHSLAYPPRDQ